MEFTKTPYSWENFLYIQGHGLAPELIRGVEAAAASFFALEDAIKRRYDPDRVFIVHHGVGDA